MTSKESGDPVSTKVREFVAALGNGMSIWKIDIDLLREQDKNARVMGKRQFERLTANIAKDNRLETLPLACPSERRNHEFELISGHHRTRAARAAGVKEIFILSFDDALNRSQIISKQLAHNAIQGDDDAETLAELWREIEDLDEKIASGITEQEVDFQPEPVRLDEVGFDFTYEALFVLFLPHQKRDFEQAVELVKSRGGEDANGMPVYVEDFQAFEPFAEQMRAAAKDIDIRNAAGILAHMAKITKTYLHLKKEALEGNLDVAKVHFESLFNEKALKDAEEKA
jgi:hypothetical protein